MAPCLSVSRSRESRSARRRKLINARSEFGGSHSCSVRAASPSRPTRATRLISTPPAHSKQRTHSTREQTAQPGRCRAINVQLDEVNDGYSAGREDHRSCSGGPAPGPRSMLPSRLCGSLPADPDPNRSTRTPSGQPRSPCFTLHPGANRLLLAPTDLMVGVLSACYTRRPQGVTHGQSRCTVLSVRRRVGRDPPQIPKLTVRVRFPSPAPP